MEIIKLIIQMLIIYILILSLSRYLLNPLSNQLSCSFSSPVFLFGCFYRGSVFLRILNRWNPAIPTNTSGIKIGETTIKASVIAPTPHKVAMDCSRSSLPVKSVKYLTTLFIFFSCFFTWKDFR